MSQSKAAVKDYLGRDKRSPAVEELILRSYFGGRTELFKQGEQASATQYDINSAYAAALRLLPDGRGTWAAIEGRLGPGREVLALGPLAGELGSGG